jgi:hypothetical protein
VLCTSPAALLRLLPDGILLDTALCRDAAPLLLMQGPALKKMSAAVQAKAATNGNQDGSLAPTGSVIYGCFYFVLLSRFSSCTPRGYPSMSPKHLAQNDGYENIGAIHEAG